MQVVMPAIISSFLQVLENAISLSSGINRFGSRYLYLCLHWSPWRQRVLYSHPWTNFMFLRLPLVKYYLYSVFQPVSWKLKVYWTLFFWMCWFLCGNCFTFYWWKCTAIKPNIQTICLERHKKVIKYMTFLSSQRLKLCHNRKNWIRVYIAI